MIDSGTVRVDEPMALAGRRILIDASMVRGGGGFTHAVNLVPRLAAREPEARFRLLVRSLEVVDAIDPPANLEVVRLAENSLATRLRFQFGEAARLAREFSANVYFSVAETAPFALPCPLIVSFRNPNVFTPIDQGWGLYQSMRLPALRRAAIRTSRRAERVVFVSHDSARWIGDSIGLAPERRAVIHHGITVADWRPSTETPSVGRDGILSVSSVYRYKNFVRLIDAWRSLWSERASVPDLTIIGDVVDREHAHAMEAARTACGALAGRVHILGRVPHRDVADHYRRAAIFAFPSYLETFGHPILEAMAADLPVVASETGVFREVADDAAVYCDPFDTRSIALALGRVLDDSSLRRRLVEAGRRRVELFSWDATAERTAEVLADVID